MSSLWSYLTHFGAAPVQPALLEQGYESPIQLRQI